MKQIRVENKKKCGMERVEESEMVRVMVRRSLEWRPAIVEGRRIRSS